MEKLKYLPKGNILFILIKFKLSLKNFNVKGVFQMSMDMTGVCRGASLMSSCLARFQCISFHTNINM